MSSMQLRALLLATTVAVSGAHSRAAGPAPAPESPLSGIGGYVDLLPYSPDRMNYQMAKSRCIVFVNHMLDRAGHDATWLPKLMPKCLWTKEECKVLEDDLLSRIPESVLPGGPAGAPAPASPAAFIATKQLRSKSPGSEDKIFGWCDTLYNMAKKRFFEKLEKHIQRPAPGMDPLPEETGDIHTDVKHWNKWMEKNVGGGPAPALSKAETTWEKMKRVGRVLKKGVKSQSGWDHFAPEREIAKKMAKGISGADHFSKKGVKSQSGWDHFAPERETAKKMAK